MDRDQFLRSIDRSDLWWTFHLREKEQFSGRVIRYLQDAYGVPISLMVKKDNDNIRDIPWNAIQYIELVPTQL